jgi:ADP-heptose:LPS heptosyltransferase
LARFGDIVLLLPALTRLKAELPESHLTLLTDARWAPVAAMCPAIDEVLTMDRIGMRDGSYWNALREILRSRAKLRRMKFDAVIDFHGFRETNLIAWWSRAPKRLGLKRAGQSYLRFCFNLPPVLEDKSLHVSDMFVKVVEGLIPLPSRSQPRPLLAIPPDEIHRARTYLPASPFAVLYVDAPVPERIWPIDRFAKLADHIITHLGGSVVVVAGPGRKPKGFREGVIVPADLGIPELAAVIASARMLVSNDTGPMHLGPALGIPTVGIFSVGFPAHFRPTGSKDRYFQGNPIERVEMEEVVDAVNQIWTATEV